MKPPDLCVVDLLELLRSVDVIVRDALAAVEDVCDAHRFELRLVFHDGRLRDHNTFRDFIVRTRGQLDCVSSRDFKVDVVHGQRWR